MPFTFHTYHLLQGLFIQFQDVFPEDLFCIEVDPVPDGSVCHKAHIFQDIDFILRHYNFSLWIAILYFFNRIMINFISKKGQQVKEGHDFDQAIPLCHTC